MRLISNNPSKFAGLKGFGLNIVAREASHTQPNAENIAYLRTKVERMGHILRIDEPRGEPGRQGSAKPNVTGGDAADSS